MPQIDHKVIIWKSDNTLTIDELRGQIRDREMEVGCAAVGCEYEATDVHHRDGDHSNNEPENLAPGCKLCHNAVHGITAQMSDLKLLKRLFYEAQEQRKAAANRVRAYENLRIDVPHAHQALEHARAYEAQLAKHLEEMLKEDTFYIIWLSRVKGIGPLLAASLMAEMGSPERFNSVSSVWSYFGFKVENGEAVRRKKGAKANWNPALKMTAWKIAGQFIKTNGCLGRQLYDRYKAYYIARDGEDPKWKPHRRALRRVAKDFLRCMYVAWREQMELPVSEPREGTWPMPDDWVGDQATIHVRNLHYSIPSPTLAVCDEGDGS